jgi:hypothetical protein
MGPIENKGEPVGMGKGVRKKIGKGKDQRAAILNDVVEIEKTVPESTRPSIGRCAHVIP